MSKQFHLRHTSRSSYPTFLSFKDTLLLQLSWSWAGLRDAFRWGTVFSTVTSDLEIRSNLYKSFMLNSLSLASIYTFDLLLHPLIREQQRVHQNLGWLYQVIWLFPVVGTSLYLNSSWCSIIAKRSFLLQHGTRAAAYRQPATYTGILTALATSAYRGVMVFTSIVVSFILGRVPYLGSFLGFAFLCWVDSYYCFEFVWEARGMSLSRRVRYLEERWAYYLAFGLPSAALCSWGNSLANAAIFALTFPVFIIMAMHARPMPLDPYNPLPPLSSRDNETIQHPSPFIPIRLPIFAPVIWGNDCIVRILSLGGIGRGRNFGGGRMRSRSDAAESLEHEAGLELNSMGERRLRPGGQRSARPSTRTKLD